jgi:hypothetical protein
MCVEGVGDHPFECLDCVLPCPILMCASIVLLAQYLFLPLTLTGSFLGVLIGNSLYLVAAVAYIYVAFLGYLGTFK